MSTTTSDRRDLSHSVILFLIFALWLLAVLSPFLLKIPRITSPVLNRVIPVFQLALVLFLLITAVAIGNLVIRWSRLVVANWLTQVCMCAGIGITVLVYVTLLLGALHLLWTWSFLAILLGALLIVPLEIPELVEQGIEEWKTHRPRLQPVDYVLLGLLTGALIPPFLSALVPPYSWDAQVYHLTIPKLYLEHHGICYVPFNVYSNMPLNIDMLFLLGMGVGDDIVAKLLHYALGLLVCVALYGFSRHYFVERVGILASVLFVTHPMVNYEFGVAFVDVGMAFFFILMVWSFIELLRSGQVQWAVIMGLFGGTLMGSKYTGALGVFSVLIVFLASLGVAGMRSGRQGEAGLIGHATVQRKWLLVAIFLCVSVALALPWLVKNLIYTGNPVYPMLYGLLDGRDWTPTMAQQLIDWQHNIGQGRTVTDCLLLPWRVFFESGPGYQHFAGKLSPLSLATLPLVIFLLGRNQLMRILLAIFVLFFILWALGVQQVRFLIPALPLLGIVAAAGIEWLQDRGLHLPYGLLLTMVVIVSMMSVAWHRDGPSPAALGDHLRVIVGEQTRDGFLRPRVRSYGCFRRLDTIASPGDRILFLFENMGYYCNFPYFADGMFEASYFVDLAARSETPEAFANALRTLGVSYVLVNTFIYRDVLRGMPLFQNSALNARYERGLRVISQFWRDFLQPIYSDYGSIIYQWKTHPGSGTQHEWAAR
jgi:hypothetical protein